MVIVTKIWWSNGWMYQEEIKRHKTNNIRRIIRDYKYKWDYQIETPSFKQKAVIIKPINSDSLNTRLFIELIPY